MIETPLSVPSLELRQPKSREHHRHGSVKYPYASRTFRPDTVSAHELQGALVLILCLYASVAVLNLQAEFAALVQYWQSAVEFLANILL